VTWEDIYNATAITYPAAYRLAMRGETIKAILEDVADNLFNPDPYYQQGGDMVRVGGVSYTIDVSQGIGNRISDLTLIRTGQRLNPAKEYAVAGWASVNEGTEGPPIWDVVTSHIRNKRTVAPREAGRVRVVSISCLTCVSRTSGTSRLSCPGIAVRRTASLRSPMTRASMRPHGETQPYRLHTRTLIMDCRVKPGKDERGALPLEHSKAAVTYMRLPSRGAFRP
jgi:hypothetical protein